MDIIFHLEIVLKPNINLRRAQILRFIQLGLSSIQFEIIFNGSRTATGLKPHKNWLHVQFSHRPTNVVLDLGQSAHGLPRRYRPDTDFPSSGSNYIIYIFYAFIILFAGTVDTLPFSWPSTTIGFLPVLSSYSCMFNHLHFRLQLKGSAKTSLLSNLKLKYLY